jgi:hypothetical protein
VIEEALQDSNYSLDFALYDQSAVTSEQFLGRYDANRKIVTTTEDQVLANSGQSLSICTIPTNCIRTIVVGQRQWRVVFSSSTRHVRYGGAAATLCVGLILTGSLVLFLYIAFLEFMRTVRPFPHRR